ncbi:MAG: hypothetical protein ACI9AV_000546, partial [Sediminicola sp.]
LVPLVWPCAKFTKNVVKRNPKTIIFKFFIMYLRVKYRDLFVIGWVLKKSPTFYVRALKNYYENCASEN